MQMMNLTGRTHLEAFRDPFDRDRRLRPQFHRFSASLVQRADKPLAILVILENRLAPIAPIHHMVNGPWIFHSELARHLLQIPPFHKYVNIKN